MHNYIQTVKLTGFSSKLLNSNYICSKEGTKADLQAGGDAEGRDFPVETAQVALDAVHDEQQVSGPQPSLPDLGLGRLCVATQGRRRALQPTRSARESSKIMLDRMISN
jgi:hypothetical protein